MTEPTKHVFKHHVEWRLDGKLHNEKEWWFNDVRHRENGPAIESYHNGIAWYLFDQEFTKEKFKQITYSD